MITTPAYVVVAFIITATFIVSSLLVGMPIVVDRASRFIDTHIRVNRRSVVVVGPFGMRATFTRIRRRDPVAAAFERGYRSGRMTTMDASSYRDTWLDDDAVRSIDPRRI